MDLVTLFLLCGVGAAEGPCATPPSLFDIPAAASRLGPALQTVDPPPSVRSSVSAIDRWQPLIAEASRRFGVPEHWIREVMRVESGGHATMNGRPIVSRAGAMGLMQVMPKTYEDLRRRHGLGADPQDPRDNIFAGTAYLREMWACFGVPGAFAAYHAGPARLTEHLASGRPLPSETRRYLARLGVRLDTASAAPGAPAECALLDERPPPSAAKSEPGGRRVLVGSGDDNELFVPLSPAPPAAKQ
jgi:soluble lytic murein transglycosylase-like protein